MENVLQRSLKLECPENKKMIESGEMEDTKNRREENERRRDWDVPSGPTNRGSSSFD